MSERTKKLAPRPRRADERVVAVTGAYSYIGSELIRRLEADRRYFRVLAIDIRKPLFPLNKTQFHKIDLTLPTADADLAGVLEREQVDTLVHAAFLSGPTHNTAWGHELESVGTMHVLNAASEAGVRKLVMLSTTLVYGAHPLNPNFLTEEHERRGLPRSRFITDKLEAERQIHRFATENPERVVTVLRLANTLGPTIHNHMTRFFSRPVCPVLMGYDPLMQFLHESDAADAFEMAVDRDFRGDFNIVGDGVLPYTTVLAMMGKIPVPLPAFVGHPLSRFLWAMQLFDMPPYCLNSLRFMCVADGAKASSVMGFVPRHDIRSTILDFLGLESQAAAGGEA